MSTFKRNAIIAGYVNSYCLVCECSFESEEQIFSHIKSEDHEIRLLACPYLDKYGNNGIRKVKAGYFCEYCNSLMATAAKVNLHIAEKLHYSNKGNSLLKQSGSIVTAFDDVLITESAWHSFADDACAICNAEFDDKDEHKVERAHLIKLLQNKVEFGDDNNLFRRIDKNDFQCLTCNCVSPISMLDEHFNDENHKQKYIKCQEGKKTFDVENPKQTKVKADVLVDEQKSEIKEDIATVGKDQNVVLSMETIAGNAVVSEATKEADTTQTNETKETLKQTTEIAKTNSLKEEPRKTQKEESTDPATYAKDNKLAYDPRNANAFCKTCENKFPSTLYGMKEHVQGRDHTSKTAKAAAKAAAKPTLKKTKLDKKPTEQFVMQVHTFVNTLGNDTIINETICVPEESCHLLTKIVSRFAEYKCQICLIDLSEDDLKEHCRTASQHETGWRQTPIIMNLKNEFVREVRSETFHCGYCNLIVAGWDAMVEHLKTQEHKNSSASCNRRLQMHLPAIRAQKTDDIMVKAAIFQMVVNHMRIN